MKEIHAKPTPIRILSLAILLLLLTVTGKSQTSDGGFVRREIIVEISPDASIEDINARYRTTTAGRIYGTNFYRLEIPSGKKEKKVRKKMAKDSDVLSIGQNAIVSSPFTAFARSIMEFPDSHPTAGQDRESFLAQQLVDDLTAVKLRSTGKDILIAVIDTGIDRTHPDIQSRLWVNTADQPGNQIDDDNDGLVDDYRGWDFVDNDNDPTEGPPARTNSISGHGTFIAGLLCLVAPGARIMAVRAFGDDGIGDAFTVASAIKYAADHGAQVINLSFGSAEESSVLRDAITYARQRGSLLVAAV